MALTTESHRLRVRTGEYWDRAIGTGDHPTRALSEGASQKFTIIRLGKAGTEH